jgi:hypothetical protein
VTKVWYRKGIMQKEKEAKNFFIPTPKEKQSGNLVELILVSCHRTQGYDRASSYAEIRADDLQDLPILRDVSARYLEGDLLALEVAEATTVVGRAATASTTSAAASTTVEATAATSTSTSTTVKAATATSTTAGESAATSTSVVGAGSGIVETDSTSSNVGAVESLESGSGLLDGGEVDISETLGLAALLIGGEGDTGDCAVLGEVLGDHVVGGLERDVSNEQSVGGGTLLVTESLAAIVAAVGEALVIVGAGSAEVNVHVATIKLGPILSLEGSLSRSRRCEFDVTETKAC